jgi:hypothetical protein
MAPGDWQNIGSPVLGTGFDLIFFDVRNPAKSQTLLPGAIVISAADH